MIVEYKRKRLVGKPCMVHEDFVPSMDLFCKYLEITKCTAHINDSLRMNVADVKGAIVVPAKKGNHLVAHAIDCNIIDSKGKMWSSKDMRVFCPELPEYDVKVLGDVKQLINLVRLSHMLRWGGDFHPDRKGNTDPVHWDDALNIRNPKKWDEIYLEIHKNEGQKKV